MRWSDFLVAPWTILGLPFILVSLGVLYVIDRLLRLGTSIRHRLVGHRFLCPTCLRFGPFCYACAACGVEAPSILAHSRGIFACECSGRNRRPALAGRQRATFEAFCAHCGARSESVLYHRRRVRVVATLLQNDLVRLYRKLHPQKRPELRSFYVCDDGVVLTYVLPLESPTDAAPPLPAGHALRALDALWLDGGEAPLLLGQMLDRFIHRSNLSEARLRKVTVLVRRSGLPPAAKHLLAARFGSIRYGVEPGPLLARGSSRRGTVAPYQVELDEQMLTPEGMQSPDEHGVELMRRVLRLPSPEVVEELRGMGLISEPLPEPRPHDRHRGHGLH